MKEMEFGDWTPSTVLVVGKGSVEPPPHSLTSLTPDTHQFPEQQRVSSSVISIHPYQRLKGVDQSSHCTLRVLGIFPDMENLGDGGMGASSLWVHARNQEAPFTQAVHHVHSQQSAETLCICKHFVL